MVRACVCACRWLLLPPEHSFLLYDRHFTSLAPSFGPGPEGQGGDAAVQHPLAEDPQLAAHFPRLHAAQEHLHECIQVCGGAA